MSIDSEHPLPGITLGIRVEVGNLAARMNAGIGPITVTS